MKDAEPVSAIYRDEFGFDPENDKKVIEWWNSYVSKVGPLAAARKEAEERLKKLKL